ncbi:TVP38/TMEM64 family protein [Yinghuangia seranimata]|uniref:TVP38/TMEM64 family protein n=1 Tax=Yinghuangia seranimata TaxID=408067 RepID=UPI00248B51D9|nr:VTT domain-containing protein [Yinghuangia seranimata]MDI2129972.1 VTT domain-containing protein [Yinghuangia seranimata]
MFDGVRDFLLHGSWTEYPTPVTIGVFVVFCALGVAFGIPKTLLAPIAGALFGVYTGLVVAMTGTVLGSLLALGIGRRLGRERVRRLLHRKQALADLDARLTRHGVVPVAILRLVPVLPGSVVNYGAAATGIRTSHFALGSTIGLLPATVVQVAAGASVRDGLSMPVLVSATAGVLLVLGAMVWARRRSEAKAGAERAETEAAPVSEGPVAAA